MRLQSKNLNKVRMITLCYIEILLQVVFLIWFLYPCYALGGGEYSCSVLLNSIVLGSF